MTDTATLAAALNSTSSEEVAHIIHRDLEPGYIDHLVQTLTANKPHKGPVCADGEQLEFAF
jgi:hypothetical protein